MTAAIHPQPPQAPAAPNVDPQEERYYLNLAARWWDTAGPFWPLHVLNQVRTGYLRRTLAALLDRPATGSQPLRGVRILDVGCGGGVLSEAMARLGAQVHGIDAVGRNIRVAEIHARGLGLALRYETATAAELPGRGVEYDAVLNMEVVEHVPDPAQPVSDCARLVRPGGALVVATINRTVLSWLCAIVGAEYLLGWLPRGTHRWDRFVKPRELEGMLHSAGLEPRERVGVRINPLNRHFTLSGFTGVNYMLTAQRPIAARSGRALGLVRPQPS